MEKNKNLEDIGFFLLESNRNKNIDRNTNYSLNSKLKNIDNNTKSNINTINKNINNSYYINEEMKKNNNQEIDNFQNKDNNESCENNNTKNKEKNAKPNMESITINDIPIGHPKFMLNDNYLNEIDNLFSNLAVHNYCCKCKNEIKYSFLDKYNLCDKCLKNEILFQLRKDYSDYLSKGDFNKKYIIKKVEINKYNLYIKDIIDIIKIKNEKEIINILKSSVCLNCLKIIENKNNYNVILPCKCFVCNKGELWNYFTIQNEISDNFTCICGYKYDPKDLYNLGTIENFELNLLLTNIFNKSILTKGCCICGKNGKQVKIQYKPEDKSSFCFENYFKLQKYNINLGHTMCIECKKRFKNQMFFCRYCNRNHFYIS